MKWDYECSADRRDGGRLRQEGSRYIHRYMVQYSTPYLLAYLLEETGEAPITFWYIR